MRNRSTIAGKRGLVSFSTLEFVYINTTGQYPMFKGCSGLKLPRSERCRIIILLRRCCGYSAPQIRSVTGYYLTEIHRSLRHCRYMMYRSYPQYYDAEFAELYKSIRSQCRVIAGLKESTIKKYKQQGKL